MLNFEIAACFQSAFIHCSVWKVGWAVCSCSALLGAWRQLTGKDQVDTGAILENEKFNTGLYLFFHISEKKINSTL